MVSVLSILEHGHVDRYIATLCALGWHIRFYFAGNVGYSDGMKLHGSIIGNLENALASARRLRGHPVYKDTVVYWAEVLQEARRARHGLSSQQIVDLEVAIAELEIELADRAK